MLTPSGKAEDVQNIDWYLSGLIAFSVEYYKVVK